MFVGCNYLFIFSCKFLYIWNRRNLWICSLKLRNPSKIDVIQKNQNSYQQNKRWWQKTAVMKMCQYVPQKNFQTHIYLLFSSEFFLCKQNFYNEIKKYMKIKALLKTQIVFFFWREDLFILFVLFMFLSDYFSHFIIFAALFVVHIFMMEFSDSYHRSC